MRIMTRFIPVYDPWITKKELQYVIKAVKSGWVSSMGEFVSAFEKEFASYVDVRYALTVSNGTAGLHLGLATLGIGERDEVIVPDLTFVATVNAVAYTGAKPVFADVEPRTWCIDPEDIERKITKRTRAIVPVHLYGHPADMSRILKIARAYGLYVIEDAAEAHGAECRGRKVGGFGDLGVFSFYGNKILTTGEGGMVTTNNAKLYERAKFLRDQAMSVHKRYWHRAIGYNYRMTNVQAAIGLAQLRRIGTLLNRKREIFGWYKQAFGDGLDIKLNPEERWAKNVFWMVSLLLGRTTAISRDGLMTYLKRRGIDTRPFFYAISQMPMYRSKLMNPNALDISSRGINLPSGYSLSRRDVFTITKCVMEALKGST
jgi:perosamine synthetase